MQAGQQTHQLLIDYVAICERRGQLLELGAFIELWTIATSIAEEAYADGPPPPDLFDRLLPDPE